MTNEDKYELLNELSELDEITTENLEILNALSYDEGDEVRVQVAEILENCEDIEAEIILIRLLHDTDGLVRATACDSLRFSDSPKVLSLLIDIIKKDKTDLVRGYAASSIGSILLNMDKVDKEYVDFFVDLVSREKVTWVKFHIYGTLYLLGEGTYLFKLIEMLNHRHFRKRGAVISILANILSDENKEIIEYSLKELLEKEETINVRSAIENVLKGIEEPT
ncbi:MAG: hypothetical protein A2Y23_01590 [Clostridiales bacterium GWB2_37_7]|nr:MAG: hypothetical protein A2Y23_01590 [Clostridiales bacterium GWB2_37_7]